jgi:hypothetical protein
MEKQMLDNNVIKPRISFLLENRECRLITQEDEVTMDAKIAVIEEFMKNNHGFGKDDSYKDELYGKAKELWRQYAAVLRDVKYTFYMNRRQFNYITTLLLQKLEYDVNTVFFAIELTNMLGTWKKEGTAENDAEIKTYTADATEVTYLYHLIAKHKIKGLTNEAYMFADILRKIGDISKVINYYDTAAKNLSKEIQEWVASFEPEESADTAEAKQSADVA